MFYESFINNEITIWRSRVNSRLAKKHSSKKRYSRMGESSNIPPSNGVKITQKCPNKHTAGKYDPMGQD